MVNDIGKVLNLFSSPIDWKDALYSNPPTDPYTTPDKLLNVALRPYMDALRECVRRSDTEFPRGDLVSIVDGPEGGKANIFPLSIVSLTPQQSAQTEQLGIAYLPLHRAGLVEYHGDDDYSLNGATFTPTKEGMILIERLEREGYFGD